MKLKDIEVGKFYADGSGKRLEVLKVGVYGRVHCAGAFSTFRSDRADYVLVRLAYMEDTVHCRCFAHSWDKQEKIDKEKKEEASKGTAKVDYLWSVLVKHAGLVKRSCWPETRLELRHGEVEKVCEALEKLGKDRT